MPGALGDNTGLIPLARGRGNSSYEEEPPRPTRTVSIFDADNEVPAGIRHALDGCARKLIHWGLSKELPWKHRLG